MFLLDTSAIIEIIKNSPIGKQIVQTYNQKYLFTTVFSVHETFLGIKDKDLDIINEFFDNLKILEYDRNASKNSALLEKLLMNKGNLINRIDIYIASLCIQNNATLITLDKDFLKVPNLRVKLYEL